MGKNVNEQQTVLYEFNNMTNVVFLSENSFPNNPKILTHKLEYIKNFEGVTDVIRYSRCNNENIVSYYTIRNGKALCGFIKDEEISWDYVEGMINFVAARFKAFKENGITFINEELNNLFNKKTYTRRKKR